MVKIIFLLFCVCFNISTVWAEETKEVDIVSWVSSVKNRDNYKYDKMMIKKILVIDGWDDERIPQYVDLHFKEEKGFLHFISPAIAEWSFQLNVTPHMPDELPVISLADRIKNALLITGADSLLILPEQEDLDDEDSKEVAEGKSKQNKSSQAKKNEKWRLVHVSDGKIVLNIVKKAPPNKEYKTMVSWLEELFGYQAVVVDSKPGYVLVEKVKNEFNNDKTQGLALKDTFDKIIVRKKSKKGVGILSFVKSHKHFAIFREVFMEQGVNQVPIGTKVILEGNKAK